MRDFVISLNQLADFTKATEKGKIRIVKQQLAPDRFRIIWYQKSKSGIKKCLKTNCNLEPIYDALDELNRRKPENPRQLSDKTVSIEALKRFIKMNLPRVLKENLYSVVKPTIKTTLISDVQIIVAPDIVVRFDINGQIVVGAIKIHISKRKPFDYGQSIKVSTILYKYLNEIKMKDEIVDPNLCFSLDVFSDRIVTAPINIEEALKDLEKNCDEIKSIWEHL